MTTTTKKYKVENFDSVSRQRDMLMFAMHDIQNNLVSWGEWVSEPGHGAEGKYKAGLSRMDSSPVLTLIWRCKGQSDSITVHDADEFESECRRYQSYGNGYDDCCLRAICSAKVAATKEAA